MESQRNQSACVKIPIIDAGPAGQAQRVPRPEPLCMTTERADMSAASPDRTYRTQSTVKRSAWLGPLASRFSTKQTLPVTAPVRRRPGARHEQRPNAPRAEQLSDVRAVQLVPLSEDRGHILGADTVEMDV